MSDINRVDFFWDYYMSIERELYKTVEYVEPCEENFSTYSQEYAKIINVACAEADVIFKELCMLIASSYKPKGKNENIDTYMRIILEKFPQIEETWLRIDRSKIDIFPFRGWSDTGKLFWWKDYQKIKHERKEHYSKANLKNAIFSVGALRILELYYLRMHSKNKNNLANKNGPFFKTVYTNELLFLSDNIDLPDFIEENKKETSYPIET